MGTQPRTIGNVVDFVNQKLAAEGVETRLATQRQAGQPRKIEVGGQTIDLPPSSDQWALNVKIGTSEKVSFSAPRSEEHTSELQSLMRISSTVLCLKKKTEE